LGEETFTGGGFNKITKKKGQREGGNLVWLDEGKRGADKVLYEKRKKDCEEKRVSTFFRGRGGGKRIKGVWKGKFSHHTKLQKRIALTKTCLVKKN